MTQDDKYKFFREGFLRRGGGNLPNEDVCKQLFNDYCNSIEPGSAVKHKQAKYPFDTMKIKESFKINLKQQSVAAIVSKYNIKNTPKQYIYMPDGESFRVCRIK